MWGVGGEECEGGGCKVRSVRVDGGVWSVGGEKVWGVGCGG